MDNLTYLSTHKLDIKISTIKRKIDLQWAMIAPNLVISCFDVRMLSTPFFESNSKSIGYKFNSCIHLRK